MGKQLRFLLNLTADDIDLVSRAYWSWMETIDPEHADENRNIFYIFQKKSQDI